MNNLLNLISAALFYALPVTMGMLVTLILSKRQITKYFLFNSFAVGGIIIYMLYLLKLNSVLSAIVIAFLSLCCSVILLVLVTNKHDTKSKESDVKEKARIDVATTLIMVALCLTVYGIWKIDAPFNTSLNWDLYHHQTLANSIQTGSFSILTTGLSDTFKFAGYTTIFHTLLALPQTFLKVDILGFWWYLEFFHLLTTVFASFVVAYSFTKSRFVGLVAAIIGAFVFETHGAYTSLFLIPQNLSATLGAVLIAQFYAQYERKRDVFRPIYLLMLAFIILNHFVVGSLVLAFYVAVSILLISYHSRNYPKLFKMLVGFFIALCILFPVVSSKLDLSTLNRGEAEFFNFTVAQKESYNRSFYGNAFYPLVVLGLAGLVTIKAKKNYILFFLTLASLSILFAPVPYSTKLYSLTRYFVHTTMALGLWLVVRRASTRIKLVTLALLLLTFSIVFIANITTYKQVPYYRESSTHISPNEIKAAEFLKAKYSSQNVLMLSDPATMHVLEALSGVDTPGGAYTNLRTRQILTNIYYTRNSKSMALSLLQARDGLINQKPDKLLLVVGGRLSKWEQASDEDRNGIQWNVWVPYDLTPKDLEAYDFVDFVGSYSKFKMVYKNSGIVIFEVENNAKLF